MEETMSKDRREFMKIAGAATAVAGAALATTPTAAQTPMAGQFKGVKALAFDAYGPVRRVCKRWRRKISSRRTAATSPSLIAKPWRRDLRHLRAT
jgi:hypothetical protein